MAATQIKEMRYSHMDVLDLILANPHLTLKELSGFTGYTVAWLSQIMRSDCFTAEYSRRRGPIEAKIMSGIPERLNNLAHLAIDSMEELYAPEIKLDVDDKIDAFDKVIKAAGYAPNARSAPAQIGQQNNVFVVQQDELAQLRGQIIHATAETLPNPQPAAPLTIEQDAESKGV